MKLYKLTDENDLTYGGCQWGENVTVETSGKGNLCGPGFTHWYTHPLLAVLLNPVHGNFDLKTAHLWKGKGEVIENDNGLKVGCKKATTIKRIPLPVITIEQKIKFAILCSLKVYTEESFKLWAENWLSGKDRAEAAAWSARAAADSAAWSARAAADSAAWATARAAESAVWAVESARAAAESARAAAESARAAENKNFDLIALAKKAVEDD